MTQASSGVEQLTPVKRALLEIRDLRAKLDAAAAASREPIAIVGTGLRLPGGVADLDTLWDLLISGRDAITAIPADRWDVEAMYDADPDAPGKMFTRHGGFLEHVDRFDAEFFGISPREAESMDPQQRIVLETAWHALEDAGIAPPSLHESRTGVFLGVCNNDYGRMVFAHPDRIDPYFSPGNAASVVAGRLSYFMGLQGPSLAVDTACSSSLVAIHLAVQSLRNGESDLAIAGGVNLILSPEMNIDFSKARMMAPDGRCKTFDAAADGYVRGEGCAMIVLKRMRDCTPADRVLAVVRGSAVNQDGRSGGLTAPNGPSQEAVIRGALESAGVTAGQIAFVEAHGTGTALGDPIEVQALGAALGRGRDTARPVAIGSIKTNVGHLEAAAGIAGVLKVVLMLRHREIPPHLHLNALNPLVDWAALPIVVPVVRTPLAPIEGRYLAGVSSFGFSGTNAHVIVEAAPDAAGDEHRSAQVPERPQHVLTLSARDAAALELLARQYTASLDVSRDAIADRCFTANTGRAHFAQRLSARGNSAAALRAALDAAIEKRATPGLAQGTTGSPPRIAFLFTGGGAQSSGMARGLYDHAPVFRHAFDAAAAILDPLIGRSLIEVLNAPGDLDAPINQTRYGQPALVAVEIALAMLWRSWGIEPAAVLGHSLGEYAAAHIAGAIKLDDALRIVVERTRLVDSLPPGGGMATVFAGAADVEDALARTATKATIAAYNGPAQVVVSGPTSALAILTEHFAARGVRVAPLRVAYASHSPMMEPVLAPFERALSNVHFSAPDIAFVSNLTGSTAGLDLIGRASYWRDHLRQPVRFAQSIKTLVALGITHFVEIGPHPVLTGMGAECVAPGVGAWLPSLRRGEDDWSVILDGLQQLYVDGAAVDWNGFDAPYARRRVALPTYPFQGRRHWAEWAKPRVPVVDHMQSWRALTGALARQADRGPLDIDLTGYVAKWECLERLTTAHAADVLRTGGIFTVAGDRATADDVRRRLGAPESYRHLLERWLTRLATSGQLRADGQAFAADRPLPDPDLSARWAEAEALLADNQPLLAYIRNCGALLHRVLAGAESPLETLFPGGAFDLADGLYRRSSTMRYINDLATSAVESFVAARGATPIRVLEIGAGTGGTTAALLPVFAPERTTYRFTDITPFFLEHARENLTAYPFVEFGELDIDHDIDPRVGQPGTWDLVIASNAVHATRDLRATLTRLRSLLAPGGVLLLIESTVHLAWFDITTGLIEGWQLFSDDLRTDNPLLPASTWLRALDEAGFEGAGAWPAAGSPAASLGQHVVIARAPGSAGDRRDAERVAAADASAPRPAQSAAAVAQPAQFRAAVVAALPADRLDLLRDFVRERVVRVLRLEATESPGRNARLMDLGFDSLMAVQLRNQLGVGLGLDRPLPATLMFDYPTIDALAENLLGRLAPAAGPATVRDSLAGSGSVTAGATTLDRNAIATMSDAEIEALLDEGTTGS